MNAQAKTLADFEGILLASSLTEARAGKSNPSKVEFYAAVAYPASAAAELAELAKTVAPNGNLAGLRMTIEPNIKKGKPFAGIPDDSLIMRLTSGPDYPPAAFTDVGGRIPAGQAGAAQVREHLYAGQRVRVNGYPYYWTHAASGSRGISWNLSGVMSIGGGERRGNSGESNEAAFGRYGAIHDAPPPQTEAQASGFGAPAQGPAASADPFNQGTARAAAEANPFGG